MNLKKTLRIFFLSLFLAHTAAAQNSENFTFKGEFIYGTIIKHTDHLKNIVKGPVMGGEVAVEWQSADGWHRYFNYPYLGVGAAYLNLGNPDILGNALAVYPYINFPIVRAGRFSVNFKAGAGLSYVTKTFADFRENVMRVSGDPLLLDYKKSNAAIGSPLNVYFAAGFNADVPLSDNLSFTAEYGWNHISNGMIKAPNSGINMLNAFIGLKYTPNFDARRNEYLRYFYAPDLPRDITCEITVSGGLRQRYMRDGGEGYGKTFPIASLAAGVYKPLTNFYRMGIGGDFFYDGVYTTGLSSGYKREYITVNELKNKLRFGISWQNELIMGRFTAGIHAGVYLFNPVKNLEPFESPTNKGIIYSYDPEKEVGWFYTRVSGKYLLTKHIYASIGLKTHLQKAEFIEWGLGYRF